MGVEKDVVIGRGRESGRGVKTEKRLYVRLYSGKVFEKEFKVREKSR